MNWNKDDVLDSLFERLRRVEMGGERAPNQTDLDKIYKRLRKLERRADRLEKYFGVGGALSLLLALAAKIFLH